MSERASPSPLEALTFDEQLERAQGLNYVRLLLGARRHARVQARDLQRIERELMAASLDDVLDLFPADRMLANFVLNIWEWAHGVTTLASLPWNISLPISDVCNARCIFCTSWLDGRKQLTLEQLERFEPVLRTAVYVGLVGHGEPLSHPRLGEIADRLEDYLDPRASSYTITNGVFLAKWLDRLEQLRLTSISCSLNAATPQTHNAVMGFPVEEFPRIVESLRTLTSSRSPREAIAVSITLVVTQQNVHEIPAFIELGNELGVRSIYLRTLLPQGGLVAGLNYHVLPPYLHPDFESLRRDAIAAIRASAVPVHGQPDTWGNPIFSQALTEQIAATPPALVSPMTVVRDREAWAARGEYYKPTEGRLRGERNANPALADNLKDGSNPLGREAPFRCRAVYNNMYVNELFLRLAPCCYLTNTPGHDDVRVMDMADIAEAWNAASFRDLRERLARGPLYGACERCPESW
jgi:hypothetical protein